MSEMNGMNGIEIKMPLSLCVCMFSLSLSLSFSLSLFGVYSVQYIPSHIQLSIY